jgi:hypothetical protein
MVKDREIWNTAQNLNRDGLCLLVDQGMETGLKLEEAEL